MSKKIKIQITHWITGIVLFEYESENNTLAKTVERAVAGYADLRYADLRYADLRYADLRYADLRSADLRSADLRSADLGSADLRSANLRSADLRYADLGYADLRSADLRYADLGYANLRSADLGSANLRSAKNAKLAVAMTRILPEGDIIGWKKCRDNIIVKLLIPAKARRSHAFGRKCRAEYAEVLQIYKAKEAYSSYDSNFIYRKGEIVKPTAKWDEDFTNECSTGIHFYVTKEEALNHD